MKTKKLICILLTLCIIFTCSIISIADSKDSDGIQFISNTSKPIADNISLVNANIINAAKNDEINPYVVGTLEDEVFSGTSQLTTDNPFDIWIFNIPTGDIRYLLTNFTSVNANYSMYICSIDLNAGSLTPLVSVNLGETFGATISEGDYAFYMFSNDSLGDSYIINYNFTASTSLGSIISFADDLSAIIVSGSNSAIYRNGELINTNFTDNDPNLAFERSWQYNWTETVSGHSYGCYNYRHVEFVNVKTGNYDGNLYSYNSPDYVNSSCVILIPIMQGTNYISWYTQYRSYASPPATTDQNDCFNNPTPRTLNSDDELSPSLSYLVFDLITNKVIDVLGNLNSFYSLGNNQWPVVSQIQ